MTQLTHKFIGESIRGLRKARNLTLSDLAGRLNISYQQLQKYETGTNRITADKLFEIANILGVDFKVFFPHPTGRDYGLSRTQLKLAKNYSGIVDEKLQKIICELTERLSLPHPPTTMNFG